MILTHITALGPDHLVHFTRVAEPALHVLIEKSRPDGSERVAVGALDPQHSLLDLYAHVAPLLYGGRGSLENWQRAEIESLIRPLLRRGLNDF